LHEQHFDFLALIENNGRAAKTEKARRPAGFHTFLYLKKETRHEEKEETVGAWNARSRYKT